MPYCRRCGTQLEENAKFCHRCGFSVVDYVPPVPVPTQQSPPPTPTPTYTEPSTKPSSSNRILILVVSLIAILIIASVAVALLFTPMTPWSYSKSLSTGTPDIDTLNLNFATNVGEVSIMTLEVGDYSVLIHVQGNGSYSYLTKTDNPMSATFDNQTAGSTLTVDSQVKVENAYLIGADVSVQIYVNPSMKLNLNITSITGRVSLTGDRGSTFESLSLQTTTGQVEANLQGSVSLDGPVSLKAVTGAVSFRMNEIKVNGNCTLNLQTTTGDIGMDITQTSKLNGNVAVNAATTTGTIYLGLEVDNGVGGKITSTTNIGSIQADVSNFLGNKSPLTSRNYPSESNIEITNTVGVGDINIAATSQTVTIAN